MLSQDRNERLTRVGPGTPAGMLLRRYWQPLCPVADLTPEKPKKRVKIMGEDLVAFREPDGAYGCVGEQCAHRRCSLYYGFVEEGGIRCPYHGWKYARDGRCLEQPFEPANSPLKDEAKQPAYPVEALAGLLFVYMGPLPAPLLPRWDVCVREDGTRRIEIRPTLACNWLQIQENAVDTTHTYYLHGHMAKLRNMRHGGGEYYYRPILKYDFTVTEWGIEKRILYGGDHPEDGRWPPMIFPNMLRIPQGRIENMHWRVPVDDDHTRYIIMAFKPNETGEAVRQDSVPVDIMPSDLDQSGDYSLASFFSQDRMAWETQGAVLDRGRELLGASDRGIALLRRMLEEQIAIVEKGGEPMGLLRDPEKNGMIAFTAHSVNRLDEPRREGMRANG